MYCVDTLMEDHVGSINLPNKEKVAHKKRPDKEKKKNPKQKTKYVLRAPLNLQSEQTKWLSEEQPFAEAADTHSNAHEGSSNNNNGDPCE